VAELRFEGSTLTLSGEPKLAGEVGEKLATIIQEQDGAAFQLSVEIYGQVWHHKPKEVSTTTQELIAAGRRLESNGNPALDPTVLAVLAASEMGDSRYFVGGKLVSVSLLLVVVVCFFCCVVYCGEVRNPSKWRTVRWLLVLQAQSGCELACRVIHRRT
jgi:hypothetical protein